MIKYPTRFYDGSPGRELVECPDCAWPMDPGFPHMPEDCAAASPVRSRRAPSAVELIRRYALTHRFLSINELRAEMDEQAIAPASRGPAFGEACRRGFIRANGHTPSSDPGTKGHDIKTYTSLIVSGASTEKEGNTA